MDSSSEGPPWGWPTLGLAERFRGTLAPSDLAGRSPPPVLGWLLLFPCSEGPSGDGFFHPVVMTL